MAHAKQAISEKEFYSLFKEKILPKYTKYIDFGAIEDSPKKKAAGLGAKELEHMLEKELPLQIYAASLKQETGPSKPGAIKLLEVIGHTVRYVQGRGYGKLAPFIIGLIQPAIVLMYQKHIEKSVDAVKKNTGFNLEQWLEDRTGIKLDSNKKEEKEAKAPTIAELATKPTT